MLIDEPLIPERFRNTPIDFPNNSGVFCLNINNNRKIIPIDTRLIPHSSFIHLTRSTVFEGIFMAI